MIIDGQYYRHSVIYATIILYQMHLFAILYQMYNSACTTMLDWVTCSTNGKWRWMLPDYWCLTYTIADFGFDLLKKTYNHMPFCVRQYRFKPWPNLLINWAYQTSFTLRSYKVAACFCSVSRWLLLSNFASLTSSSEVFGSVGLQHLQSHATPVLLQIRQQRGSNHDQIFLPMAGK